MAGFTVPMYIQKDMIKRSNKLFFFFAGAPAGGAVCVCVCVGSSVPGDKSDDG